MSRNRPSAKELVEAVQEFLEAELQPVVTDGSLGFKLRIALNVLSLLPGELESGPEHDAHEIIALQLLLACGSDRLDELVAELCRQIRQGVFDERQAPLLDFLRPSVMNKLSIDNPRYSTYRKLLADEPPRQ